MKDGRRLAFEILVPSSSPSRRQAAVAMQEMWRQVDADAEVTAVEFPVFQERLARGDFDVFIGAYLDEPSARGLAAERALLDVARSALARGEASEALSAAERHRREYPDGALVEEREAIAIKALVALGKRDEAAKRLANLEKSHPNSIVLRAAKKAVSGAP